MSFTIGIDVGGTFTDIVVAGSDGKTIIAKARQLRPISRTECWPALIWPRSSLA